MSLQHSIPYLLIWPMTFAKALENYQSPPASKEVPLLGKKKKTLQKKEISKQVFGEGPGAVSGGSSWSLALPDVTSWMRGQFSLSLSTPPLWALATGPNDFSTLAQPCVSFHCTELIVTNNFLWRDLLHSVWNFTIRDHNGLYLRM